MTPGWCGPCGQRPDTVEPWPASPVMSASRRLPREGIPHGRRHVRNEPSFNPAMTNVESLTDPLPIGLGTRFRARMGRAGTQMLVELTEFDRPHQLGSRTTSSMMGTSWGTDLCRRRRRHSHELGLAGAPEGRGLWQLGPLFGPLGGRMERRIWTGLKHQLETT